jgi:hypothetical protein
MQLLHDGSHTFALLVERHHLLVTSLASKTSDLRGGQFATAAQLLVARTNFSAGGGLPLFEGRMSPAYHPQHALSEIFMK